MPNDFRSIPSRLWLSEFGQPLKLFDDRLARYSKNEVDIHVLGYVASVSKGLREHGLNDFEPCLALLADLDFVVLPLSDVDCPTSDGSENVGDFRSNSNSVQLDSRVSLS